MNKQDIINSALASVQQQYSGRARIISEVEVVDVIPSGSYSIDELLGCCGYPRGRIVEMFGGESCGKTTAALHLIAEAQKRGKVCCFVDAEHSYDAGYAQLLGVNIAELIVLDPATGEEAFRMMQIMLENGVDVVVVDSVAGLTPEAELEVQMDSEAQSGQGAMMSKGLRKLSAKAKHTNALVFFTNQIRYAQGDTGGFYKTTPGGNALKFYASVRLKIENHGTITENDKAIGFTAKVSVVKSKMAPPNREASVPIIYSMGFDRIEDLVYVAVKHNIITMNDDGKCHFNGDLIDDCYDHLRSNLSQNAELRDQIATSVKKAIVFKPESYRPRFK